MKQHFQIGSQQPNVKQGSTSYGRNQKQKQSSGKESQVSRHYKISKRSHHRKSLISKSLSTHSFSKSMSMAGSSYGSPFRMSNEHFQFKIGQRIGHRYRITKLLGDGTFGRVVQCRYKNKLYAVKIIKPVDRYIDSAKTERAIIKHVNSRDERDREGIVRYVKSFYHDDYFCMAFEPLGKSLYDVIRMNEYTGFPIALVQSFFKQILKSMTFLHKIGYTHTDLKPQNILLQSEQLRETQNPSKLSQKKYIPTKDKVRIIDFGGATKFDDFHSSIINTRQYRCPEVVLQCCKWNEISDVWSIGCIIVELLTGDVLFNAHEDFEHLLMMQKNSGNFPQWMIAKSEARFKGVFLDGKISEELIGGYLDSWRSIDAMLTAKQICKDYPQLSELLAKCLQIDPNKRITCAAALNHPFFQISY